MAGVRLIDTSPVRYAVTFTHYPYLDDCELRIVELVLVGNEGGASYLLCLKHQLMDCKCVAEVIAHRERIGLGDRKFPPVDEDWKTDNQD